MNKCKGCIYFEANENGYPCDHCVRLSVDCEKDFFQTLDGETKTDEM